MKPFDRQLYADNDTRAKSAVMRYVSQAGVHIEENTNMYGPDLVVYTDYVPSSYIEAEVKIVWKSSQEYFPWNTVQIPERKSKFLKTGLPIEFFILRNDLKLAIVIPDYVMEGSPKKEVPNKLMASGEWFYTVDVSQCNLVNLED